MIVEEKIMVKWKNNEPYIPLYYKKNIRENTDALIIYLHGGVTKNCFPYYNGLSISKDIKNSSFILFSDPIRFLNPDLIMGWYCSPHKEEEIVSTMAQVINSHMTKYGFTKTVVISGSAGGIACVRLCSYLNNISCFVWNPQTEILNYHSSHLKKWKSTVKYIKKSEKTNILQSGLYKQENEYYFTQKITDKFHIDNHFKPLCEVLGAEHKNIHLCIDDWDDKGAKQRLINLGRKLNGHYSIPREILLEILINFVNSSDPIFDFHYWIKYYPTSSNINNRI